MSVYGFADLAEFERAAEALRWVRERMGRTEDPAAPYSSDAVTVVIEDPADLPASYPGTSAAVSLPTEPDVYVCSPVYRDLSVTDPDDPAAWVRYGGVGTDGPDLDFLLEAFGPNREALTVGSRYMGRVVGVSFESPFRPRVLVTVGGGGTTPFVRLTENTQSDAWTGAVLQTYDSDGEFADVTLAGGTGTGADLAYVAVKPVPGVIGLTGQYWQATDTGRFSPDPLPADETTGTGDDTGDAPGLRRYRLERDTGESVTTDWRPVRVDGMVEEGNFCRGYYGRRVVRSQFREWVDDPLHPDKVAPIWPQTDFGPPPQITFIPVPDWVDRGDDTWDEPSYAGGKYYREKIRKNAVLLGRPAPERSDLYLHTDTDGCEEGTANPDWDTANAWEVRIDDDWVPVAIMGFAEGDDSSNGYWGYRIQRSAGQDYTAEPRYWDGSEATKITPIYRMPSVLEPPSLVDFDKNIVGQTMMCRPSLGWDEADHKAWEMMPWGAQLPSWDCFPGTAASSPPLYHYACYPTAGYIQIGSCKFGVTFTEWEKVGFKVKARDLEFNVIKKTVTSCDDHFDDSSDCSGGVPR